MPADDESVCFLNRRIPRHLSESRVFMGKRAHAFNNAVYQATAKTDTL